MSSIKEKLLTLPDELVVYPGHGDITTIGAERAHNPFLR
jgi:glyoxylase-like metal-dependent hydrolase (beta-lactamase superfamily II)